MHIYICIHIYKCIYEYIYIHIHSHMLHTYTYRLIFLSSEKNPRVVVVYFTRALSCPSFLCVFWSFALALTCAIFLSLSVFFFHILPLSLYAFSKFNSLLNLKCTLTNGTLTKELSFANIYLDGLDLNVVLLDCIFQKSASY